MILNLSEKYKHAFNLIRNRLVHVGKMPTLREINEVTGGKSPRSASIVIERLVKLNLLERRGAIIRLTKNASVNPSSISTVNVPLVGTVSCGLPILATENIETYLPVSTMLAKDGFTHFLLRASGDSMNQSGINNGDILLIRQQPTAETGQRVVALINDNATVKFFERIEDAVILRPRSTNEKHKPIIVTDNCQIQGIVIAVLPSDLT